MTERGHRLAKGISTPTRPECPRTQTCAKEKEEETRKEVNQQPECGQVGGDTEDAVGCLSRGVHRQFVLCQAWTLTCWHTQIVSYMHPSDLLRISRVSKHFRSMLMTKNAVSFWRAARKNIGMPNPPPDLNDAQYVALIFENICNVCRPHPSWSLTSGSLHHRVGVRRKSGVVQDFVAKSTVVQEMQLAQVCLVLILPELCPNFVAGTPVSKAPIGSSVNSTYL